MVVRYRQHPLHRMPARLGQHQTRQRGTRPAGQPPTVMIGPAQARQLFSDQAQQLPATTRPRQAATALGNGLKPRVLRQPRLPEPRLMPGSIAAVTQPVQVHAERLQVLHRGVGLGMPTQQADGGKTKALAGRRQGVQVIGPGTAQADDTLRPRLAGKPQVIHQFEPLVATDQRVDQVQTQHRDLDTGTVEPVQVQGFEGGVGRPIGR